MSRFLSFHYLATYPASCLVANQNGQPKTIEINNSLRGRISSQAMKYGLRTSREFAVHAGENRAVRTREAAKRVAQELVGEGYERQAVNKAVVQVMGNVFTLTGFTDSDAEGGVSREVVFLAKSELEAAREMVRAVLRREKLETTNFLQTHPASIDLALFGRMFASPDAPSIAGALALSHPFTITEMRPAVDHFVAVDDLTEIALRQSHLAAYMGTSVLVAGTFIGSGTVDLDQLMENLRGDRSQARLALEGLFRALPTTGPRGRIRNSNAQTAMEFILLEASPSPRSYAWAFASAIHGESPQEEAISRILEASADTDRLIGGNEVSAQAKVDLVHRSGSLDSVVETALSLIPQPARQVPKARRTPSRTKASTQPPSDGDKKPGSVKRRAKTAREQLKAA